MENTIISDMDSIRDICSGLHSARKALKVPSIQPLDVAVLFRNDVNFLLSPYCSVIQDECNIDRVEWEFITPAVLEEYHIYQSVSLNFKEAGKILGGNTQRVAKALARGEFTVSDGHYTIDADPLISIPESLVTTKRTVDNEANLKRFYYVVLSGTEDFLLLDTMVYPHHYMSMLAQKLIKAINQARRDHGCEVGDTVGIMATLPMEYFYLKETQWDSIRGATKCSGLGLEYGSEEIIIDSVL